MTSSSPPLIHDQTARVFENRDLGSAHFLLTLEAPPLAAAAQAGQFVMLRFAGCLDPLLARPMSISEVVAPAAGRAGAIRILHKIVGRGTDRLAALAPGDSIQALGPLGTPFRVPAPPATGARALLIAGGIGVAVFPLLVPVLQRAGWSVTLLFGARRRGELVRADWFAAQGCEVRAATEDGSAGTQGRVTALLEQALRESPAPGIAFACGPKAMLKAVGGLVMAASLPTQLSLESYMGCGIGACLGCVVKVRRGDDFSYARICMEGPTFEAAEVLWE
jgi:dihydroorotate dehydrogenase electron transfer subunit